MDKTILSKYVDAKARVRILRRSISGTEKKLEKLGNEMVGDTVSKGKRGKKPLGTVKIEGFAVPELQKARRRLHIQKESLKAQEDRLLELTSGVECFISKVDDIEMQNILTLYYIEDETWIQVARDMNGYYPNRNYTPDACRKKHERFLKKIEKI